MMPTDPSNTLKSKQRLLRSQIVAETTALLETQPGTDLTILGITKEFHEIRGMISALAMIDGNSAGLTRTLIIARDSAMFHAAAADAAAATAKGGA
jgi:hypothetical protein